VDWPEATIAPDPPRDIPTPSEPLPKFLSDEDAAKLLAAAKPTACPLSPGVEMLSGPACGQPSSAAGGRRSLGARRVPLAAHPRRQARNDRMIPLHAELVPLLEE